MQGAAFFGTPAPAAFFGKERRPHPRALFWNCDRTRRHGTAMRPADAGQVGACTPMAFFGGKKRRHTPLAFFKTTYRT